VKAERIKGLADLLARIEHGPDAPMFGVSVIGEFVSSVAVMIHEDTKTLLALTTAGAGR